MNRILAALAILAGVACSETTKPATVKATKATNAAIQTDATLKILAPTKNKFDFGIPLDGISDPGMLLAHFSQRPLVIFYYSPKCPHCQATYPKLAKLIDQNSAAGLTAIAISIGQAKKNDIRAFMDQLSVTIPMFQDTEGKFSATYGSGHVPLIVVVHPNGELTRYAENNDEEFNKMVAEVQAMVKK